MEFHCDARDGKGDLQISLLGFMNSHYIKISVSTDALSDGDFWYWLLFPAYEFRAAFLLHSVHYFSSIYIASTKSLFGNIL